MIEPSITAEDLTLYALDLLEGDEQAVVDAMLQRSRAAREELAMIRGDLALFAMGAEQHTPPSLTRQRLMKQVARERRTVPVEIALPEEGVKANPRTFTADRGDDSRLRQEEDRPRSAASSPDVPTVSDPTPGPPSQQGQAASRTLPIRTFPTRAQAVRQAADAVVPVPRLTQESQAVPREAGFAADTVSFSGTPGSASAERQTFSPDTPVFPRDTRATLTSATAHSITIFEQHFAAEAIQETSGPSLPPDLKDTAWRRRREPTDAVGDVQDRFVPSSAAQEAPFAFSSYGDQSVEEARGSTAGRWLGWSGWALAATVAVAAVLALRDDFHLREQSSQQQSSLAQSQAGAARADTVLQTLQSIGSQHFLLSRTDAAPAPMGHVTYLPERASLVFQGSNLETLQPYKTYELWLIPAGEGRQPVPAGVFKPDGHGFATVLLPPLQQKGMIATNFGVTIEDEGGSTTPTLPILLVGQQP